MAKKTRASRPAQRTEELVSDLWTPVWICPTCGRPFARRNQSHSCGGGFVRQYLEGKPPEAIALYRRFAELVRRCGPVAILPGPHGIAFQVRTSFAAIDRLTAGALSAHVVLDRTLDHPRFTRVDVRSPRHRVHHFRVAGLDELDDEVAGWLAEAYRLAG